jgi:hypothetical protein
MLKHIAGQSIFQITVVLLFVFLGPYFLPESADPDFDSELRRKMITHYPELVFPSTFMPRFRDGNQDTGTLTFGNFKTVSGQPVY